MVICIGCWLFSLSSSVIAAVLDSLFTPASVLVALSGRKGSSNLSTTMLRMYRQNGPDLYWAGGEGRMRGREWEMVKL